MTHNRDLVPNWPPVWVGFHHVATEVWVIDVSIAHVRGPPCQSPCQISHPRSLALQAGC